MFVETETYLYFRRQFDDKWMYNETVKSQFYSSSQNLVYFILECFIPRLVDFDPVVLEKKIVMFRQRISAIPLLYEYNMGWASLHFKNRKAVYKKRVNWFNQCYVSITLLAIVFVPYYLIFC